MIFPAIWDDSQSVRPSTLELSDGCMKIPCPKERNLFGKKCLWPHCEITGMMIAVVRCSRGNHPQMALFQVLSG